MDFFLFCTLTDFVSLGVVAGGWWVPEKWLGGYAQGEVPSWGQSVYGLEAEVQRLESTVQLLRHLNTRHQEEKAEAVAKVQACHCWATPFGNPPQIALGIIFVGC